MQKGTVEVVAVKRFEHGGTRIAGDRWPCSRKQADKLAAKGLVMIPEDQPTPEHPTQAAGTPSSASPADQASQLQTSSSSGDGDTASSQETTQDPADPPATEQTATVPTGPLTTESGVAKATKRGRKKRAAAGRQKTGEGS